MKKILKLHAHKHTGKLLHHRHTSYPALFLLLALTGAILLAPMGMARADNLSVNAVVPATVPDDAAVITSPSDSTTVTNPTITVSGTCQAIDPPAIVVIYDGSVIAGSQSCGADGSFAIPVSLTPGSHSLVPHVMNFTGQEGPVGTAILVIFTPPVVTSTNPTMPSDGATTPQQTNTNTSTTQTAPTTDDSTNPAAYPEIVTDTPYVIFAPNKPAIWKGTLRSGTPPYNLTVNWGDGTVEKILNVQPGPLTLSHHYKVARMYELRVEIRDANGRVLGVSIVALSPAGYNAYTATPGIINSTTNLPRTWLLYTLYILTVVALTIFWHRQRLHYTHQAIPVIVSQKRRPAANKRKRR